MSGQESLTVDAPFIVDLTCSTKRVWPEFASVRLDVDPEVRPDMVWDGRTIPFPDSSVDVLYYDPPHYIGRIFKKAEMSAWFASVNRKKYPHQHFLNCVGRFSAWTSRALWVDALFNLNIEAKRVLRPTGTLNVKLCEVDENPKKSVQRKDADLLSNFTVAAEKQTTSKAGKNPTYWLTMRPTPKRYVEAKGRAV